MDPDDAKGNMAGSWPTAPQGWSRCGPLLRQHLVRREHRQEKPVANSNSMDRIPKRSKGVDDQFIVLRIREGEARSGRALVARGRCQKVFASASHERLSSGVRF